MTASLNHAASSSPALPVQLVGDHPSMVELRALVAQAVPLDTPVVVKVRTGLGEGADVSACENRA